MELSCLYLCLYISCSLTSHIQFILKSCQSYLQNRSYIWWLLSGCWAVWCQGPRLYPSLLSFWALRTGALFWLSHCNQAGHVTGSGQAKAFRPRVRLHPASSAAAVMAAGCWNEGAQLPWKAAQPCSGHFMSKLTEFCHVKQLWVGCFLWHHSRSGHHLSPRTLLTLSHFLYPTSSHFILLCSEPLKTYIGSHHSPAPNLLLLLMQISSQHGSPGLCAPALLTPNTC